MCQHPLKHNFCRFLFTFQNSFSNYSRLTLAGCRIDRLSQTLEFSITDCAHLPQSWNPQGLRQNIEQVGCRACWHTDFLLFCAVFCFLLPPELRQLQDRYLLLKARSRPLRTSRHRLDSLHSSVPRHTRIEGVQQAGSLPRAREAARSEPLRELSAVIQPVRWEPVCLPPQPAGAGRSCFAEGKTDGLPSPNGSKSSRRRLDSFYYYSSVHTRIEGVQLTTVCDLPAHQTAEPLTLCDGSHPKQQ